MMKSRKPIVIGEEENEEEDDAVFREEEARIKAERLKKELEEQNKFDCLCDGVLNSLSLVDSSFSELLELKDELLQHNLPPSLLVAIALVTGKMFRSITDLHTPIQELTRLVNVYSIPWEQRSESLKKLHADYESKQRQLNIAIRRLQMIDAQSRRLEKEKRIMNWEKAFAKVSSSKSHGRRWKFMIDAIKRKIKQGVDLSELEVDESDEEPEKDEDELVVSTDEVANTEQDDQDDKQRFMLSVIAASPPADDDGTPQPGSDMESEGEGIPSEISDTITNLEESSPDMKPRRGVSFGGAETEVVREVVKEVPKPPCEDRAVWTHEPEYDTKLAVRFFRPLDLKDDDGLNVSCTVSFGDQNEKTPPLPLGFSNAPALPAEEADETKSKTNRRKSIGFASQPVTPPGRSIPSKSGAKKPSSILKKKSEEEVTSSSDQDHVTVDLSKYHECRFDSLEGKQEALRIALFQGEKMVAMATLTYNQLLEKEAIEKYEGKEDDGFEDRLTHDAVVHAPLQGIKLGMGGHSSDTLGQLPVLFYWVKTERMRNTDAGCNTDDINQLVMELTGVDLNETTKDSLMTLLGREFNDVCTSAMSFASSSSNKSGFIPAEEMEIIKEQHNVELKGIQDEYERKMQGLLHEVETLQQNAANYQLQMQQVVSESEYQERNVYTAPQVIPGIPHPPDVTEKTPSPIGGGGGSRWRVPKLPGLPDWGAHLPKDVWVRMRMLAEEMVRKRQQLDARIRNQIASNIEKKLASQYKLQRNEGSVQGPLQDVTLPALFMPSKMGNVYNPRAHAYFHPTGTSNDLRLTQPPSIFQLPPLPEKAKMSVVNLFELSKNFENPTASEWLNRMNSAAAGRVSRATTAASRNTPNTPAPTAYV